VRGTELERDRVKERQKERNIMARRERDRVKERQSERKTERERQNAEE